MLPRRRSFGARDWSGPVLVLSASCLWGCPQLLSDDFGELGAAADPGGQPPSGADNGAGTGGSGSEAGSSGSAPQSRSGAGGAGGAGDPAVNVPGAPAVVSVSPSNGATGVSADVLLSVAFSEPMNVDAVEAAYASNDLPPSTVSFRWSEDDTQLEIVPNQPLAQATGSSAATTVARRYAFEIGSAALDRAGEALPPFSSSFTTLREITETLSAVQDRSLTGNWRSDNVYGDNSCQFDDSTTTCIGDSSNGNSSYRGFVTFDLPGTIQGVTAAQLGMTVDDIRYSPFPDLGNLVVEPVSFDSISLDAFESAALGPAVQVSSSATVGATLSADVLTSFPDDLVERSSSQFRFRFSSDTDSDSTGDLVQVLSTTERLTLTYLLP